VHQFDRAPRESGAGACPDLREKLLPRPLNLSNYVEIHADRWRFQPDVPLFPEFLRTAVRQVPDSPQHIVWVDIDARLP